MTGLLMTGRVLPQEIIFVVAGEAERFVGAPPDWITVAEYVEMKHAGRTLEDAGTTGQDDCHIAELYDNEEGVHPFR